jgi:hypothetical protein
MEKAQRPSKTRPSDATWDFYSLRSGLPRLFAWCTWYYCRHPLRVINEPRCWRSLQRVRNEQAA